MIKTLIGLILITILFAVFIVVLASTLFCVVWIIRGLIDGIFNSNDSL